MQRRLMIAMIGLALVAVVLVGAGILILAQLGARQDTEAEVTRNTEVVAGLIGDGGTSLNRIGLERALRALGAQGNLAFVEADGTVRDLSFSGGRRGGSPTVGPARFLLDADRQAGFAEGETVFVDGRDGQVIGVRALGELGDASGQAAVIVVRDVATIGSQARNWFLISAAVVLVAAAATAWLLARRLARPIRDIERATSAIAAGDLATRVDVEGDDELAELGRSVNGMAAELQRSKALDQQFLMSVSHDLRTPLTAISGYAEALQDGAVGDAPQAGAVIATHAARLERLVGDLLDLAKLDANRFRLDLGPVDAGVAVGRAVAGLTPEAATHGLSIRFDAPPTTIVRADADRLAQVLGNLLDNAIKFATAEIVAAVATDHASGRAVITIADDGPGIAPDDLPHVFERLYVSRHQPRRAENPSGMGLAIVRELVTAMGGTVAASPVPDRSYGTMMTLRLPLPSPDPKPAEATEPVSAER